MNKVLFGGAFDPIHLGHINMAKSASEELDADVIFVPAPISIWKKSSVSVEHKCAMIKLSIENYPRFSMDEFEINSGKSTNYSIDTVRHFREVFPNDTIYYLIGTDQVNKFHMWKDALELSKLAQIIYFDRPGYETNIENVKTYNMQSVPGKVVDVSSTEVKDLEDLYLPINVLKYIEENELYYIPKIKAFYSEKRYKHALEVAHLALSIAKKHHLTNSGEAYVAGILHDIGKDFGKDKTIELMNSQFGGYAKLPSFSYHQFIGAYLAENSLGIKNERILNAIMYHATGNRNMDPIAKIVYASDKIEPTRGFDSSELIQAMMDDINKGFKKVLRANRDFLKATKGDIENELTSKCFKQYLGNI